MAPLCEEQIFIGVDASLLSAQQHGAVLGFALCQARPLDTALLFV